MQKLSLVYLSIGLLLVAHDVLSGAEDIDFLVLAAVNKKCSIFRIVRFYQIVIKILLFICYKNNVLPFSDILYFETEYNLIKFSTLFHIRF